VTNQYLARRENQPCPIFNEEKTARSLEVDIYIGYLQVEAKIKKFQILKDNGEVLGGAQDAEPLPIVSIIGEHNAALSRAKELPRTNVSRVWWKPADLRTYSTDRANSGTIASYTKALVSGQLLTSVDYERKVPPL
jgi:hypothetical protein